jgi:hypothetical protein
VPQPMRIECEPSGPIEIDVSCSRRPHFVADPQSV